MIFINDFYIEHIYKMIWDEIIIGAGFAGLYWVYKTKPKNFLILEKSDRIGGRVYNVEWNNNQISLGGGIVKPNNTWMIDLVKELGLELVDGISKYHMVDLETETTNINKPNEANFYESNKIVIKYLKNIYKKNKQEITDKKLNWEEFLDLYLDFQVARTIKLNLLYQTYLQADVESVLYGEIDELLRTQDFHVKYIKQKGYTGVLDKLIEFVGLENIKTDSHVNSIGKIPNDYFEIKTRSGEIFQTKKVILATESETNINFELEIELNNKLSELYGMVGVSKYLRVYSYHMEIQGHGLECSYRTSGLPGKVIMINKNILMCCYTEDSEAIKLYNLLNKNDKSNQIEIVYKLLTNSNIKITKPDDIKIKFWDSGVHYNKPGYQIEKKKNLIKQLANKNIIVIGEAIADSHGWVNSALESVHYIIEIKNI